jgi:hypothetical protein
MDAIKKDPKEPFITFAGILDDEETYIGVSNEELEAMSSLPDILPPAAPPAFAKERVMSQLQEPIVAIFVPPTMDDQKGSV